MKKLSALLVLGFLLCAVSSYAKKTPVRFISGSLASLKGERVFGVQHDYNNMKIGENKKEKEEQVYLDEKVDRKNEKEAGSGDAFREAWVRNRVTVFEPMLKEGFSEGSRKKGLTLSNKKDPKYTLIIKTLRTEPGYHVGVARGSAYIWVTVDVVETANLNNVVAELELPKVEGKKPGSFWFGSHDYTAASRIKLAYNKCGKLLGKFFETNVE